MDKLKICTKCKIEKSLNKENFYYKNSRKKFEPACISCWREQQENYYKNNKNELINYQHEYVTNNKEKVKNRKAKYYLDNKTVLNKKKKIYREKNPNYMKEWHIKNAEKQKEYRKVKTSSEEFKRKRTEKRKSNPALRLRESVSRAISCMLKKQSSSKNGSSCLKYLDYTPAELCNYIQSLWEPWMNWTNYGVFKCGGEKKWQIDHIIPQSKLLFSSMEEENFKKCWALSNLRPLEAVENIKKSNK